MANQERRGIANNIKNNDLALLGKAMEGVDSIKRRQISNEATMAILDLQSEPNGSSKYANDILLLKAIEEDCKL